MTIAISQPVNLSEIVIEWFRREPRFAAAALLCAALILPTLVAYAFDDRLYQGINIWIKPLKFSLSVGVYLGTLAWFAGWMKWETTQTRWYRWFSILILIASFLELAWIYAAAANGVGSHYNIGTPLMSAIYGIAGVVVLVLMTSAPVYAVAISRNQRLKLDVGFRLSVIVGLWLTFVLTVVTASYLAAQPNHFVGGNLSDAEGGFLFGWAQDGGDLRAAHFFALHAMHFIPAVGLAAIWVLPEGQRRSAVLGFSALFTVFTLYVFVEAIMGRPFLGGLL